MPRLRAALVGGFLLFASPSLAGDIPVPLSDVAHWSLGRCGNPCMIHSNPGGRLDEFENAAWQARRRGIRIEIRGNCDSACTIMADRARPNVCIGTFGKLRIHQGFDFGPNGQFLGRSPVHYSPDIARWIARHGGQPTTGTLDMDSAEASRFFPMCKSRPPIRRPFR